MTTISWKKPAFGVEFAAGKLYTFSAGMIRVDRPWPPASWKREKGRPWRHDVPAFAVLPYRDAVIQRRIDRIAKRLAEIKQGPGLILNAQHLPAPAGDDTFNADGTLGNPFEAGWRSLLAWHDTLPPAPEPVRPGPIRWKAAQLRLQLGIPERARLVVAEFHPKEHAALLGLVARGGEPAYDLLKANPALALALANLPLFVKGVSKPWRSACRQLKHRQRAIAGFVGLPPAEAVARLLRKLGKRQLQARHILFLRTVLEREPGSLKVLSHLPKLGTRELLLATHPDTRAVIKPSYLTEACQRPPEDDGGFGMLLDLLLMGRRLNGQDWVPAAFGSIAQMRRFHDELVLETAKLTGSDQPFGPPPIPGTDQIRPLMTEQELIAEGSFMRNCVGGYADQVRSGRIFVYHLELAGAGATLSVGVSAGGKWALKELKCFANQPAPAGFVQMASHWLAENGF